MTEAFSFIHAADLHLDSPFKNFEQLEGVDSSIRDYILQRLQDSTFAALDNIVNKCIEHRVDFLLLAGDIFDLSDRGIRAELKFNRVMERLAEYGIDVFAVQGNHDHGDSSNFRFSRPGNVHFFPPGEIDCRRVFREDREIARVYGISYPRREVYENYARFFTRDADAPFAVGLLHCNAGGFGGHENYAPCRVDDLLNAGMDYWALGHVHSPSVLMDNNPCIAYPGTPQGRNPREAGEKGCYLVQVAENGNVDLNFLPVDDVRWVESSVSIEGLESEEELLEALNRELARIHDIHAGRAVVCRINLTGRGALHKKIQFEGVIAGILEELRSRFAVFGGDFVWPESIRCFTGIYVDKESLQLNNTLLGDLVDLGKKSYTDYGLRNKLRENLYPLENLTAPYITPTGDDEDFDRLVEEAVDMAVDLLWEES